MKKEKAMILLSAVGGIAVIVSIIIGITCARNRFTDYARILNLNWNFSLPTEAHYSEVYSKGSGTGFHGDGIRYHCFSYKENTPIREMLAWQSTEAETRYHDCYSDAVNEWLNEINVPTEERPDYTVCSYWYKSKDDGSEIIILWDKNKSSLYIAESFL